METQYYKVTKIGNEIFIAMALLPPQVDIGTRLKYEMLEYEVIEE